MGRPTTEDHRPSPLRRSIAVACLIAGCGAAPLGGPLPEPARYAPAALAEPQVPRIAAPSAESDGPLSLDGVLAFADAHAPVIETARARVGLAEAGLIEADSALPADPELSFGVGPRFVDGQSAIDFQVGLSQPVGIAGQAGARRTAARADRQVAEAEVNEARWWVHVQAHRLFAERLLAEQRRQHAERFVGFSTSLRETAARQVDAGESSPLILLVADADLARTREALVEATAHERTVETRLAVLIGWPGDELPPLAGELRPVRPAPPTDALLARMAEFHPALRRRELAVVARRAEVDVQARAAWPDPTLGLSYARESSPGPDEAAADVVLFNLGVPLPLWRGNRGARARAEAEARIADRQRAETARRLRGELRQAADALDAARRRVELYQTGVVPQFERKLELLQRAYELGEVDVHQVSQTRERLLQAVGSHLTALAAYHDTAATLEGLVGAEVWSDAAAGP